MLPIRKRSHLLAAGAALAAGGAAACLALAWFGSRGGAGGPSVPPLSATGYVGPGGLAPGRSVPVTADVFNPNYFRVSLTSPQGATVDVVVSGKGNGDGGTGNGGTGNGGTGSGGGGCAAGDVVFTARRWLDTDLDAWTSRTMSLGVLSLKEGAPATCTRAGFEVGIRVGARARPG